MPGTLDSIGAFTTTNTASVYGTYPAGTTSLYQSNSSSAQLVLPSGSTVLYAELIWGGSYINGNVNLTAAINNPVSFTTPAGTSSVTPDSATANQVDLGGGAFAYVRSANVTSLVQQGMGGTYTTSGVVGTIVINNDSTANHAGWTLGVIYQNPTLPFRNMSLRAGAVLVQSTSGPVNTTITGFATPVTGTLGGRALFSAQEGDANRTGDQALFGPTSSSLVALSGPNNFANNFFASQINNDAGQLNTTGTFGTRNQTNGAPGSNISGGRQGWDITNVDVSARLVNNQSSAVLSLTTSGDAYVVNANAIQVNINAPQINVAKSANVSGVVTGDSILYTVTVSNTGTASAASVVLSDALPQGSTFVAGSVTVAGAARPTADITTGVALGSLAFGSSITVTYRANVTSVPSPQQLVNTANAAFTFQSVAGGPVITGVIPSNGVTTTVYSPILSIAKSANVANATVGNTVTYRLDISNTGNIGATTTIADNVPAGSSFVAGSFTVNGVAVPGANPVAGVPIGTVAAGGTSVVTFQVLVNSLPSPPQLVDQATAAYTFQPPDGRTVSGSAASNTLTLPVQLPSVTVAKSVNLPDAAIGDTLTFTSVVTNTGTAAVTNVVLTDPIPAGTAFVPNSVTVGGASRPGISPASGVAVGTLPPGASATVTFQVTITSLPSPAPAQIRNQSSVSYSSGTFTGISLSNVTITPVYQAIIAIAKSANRTTATLGSIITYTLGVSNNGNIAAVVTLTDNIPAGTAFVPGSVTVGGVSQPGASPVAGIALGSIAPGAAVPVTFQTEVTSLPSPPFLVDQGAGTFTFQLPSGRSVSGSSVSNTVTVTASAPDVDVIKAANLSAVTVNDVLRYTISVVNSGVDPVTSVVVSDPIPAGAVFLPGTVTVNGAAAPGANPDVGITVGTLAPETSATVTFQVRVTSVPNPAQLSNRALVAFRSGSFSGSSVSDPVVTPVFQPVIGIVKGASTLNASVGDTFTYTFQVSNTGNIAASVTLTDTIPAGAVFETNSVIVGGTPTPGVNPLTGIPISSIPPGGSVAVSFVANNASLPPSQRLVNQAAGQYSYTLPDGRSFSGSTVSNTVSITVSVPSVGVVKNVSPTTSAVVGDILTYTVVATNNGISNINNVVISDVVSPGSSLIPGSVIVNGSPQPAANPNSGIPIGTLAPGAAATVTFEVIVTMAIPSQINNQSTVSFTSGTFSGTSSSNVTTVPVTQPQIALTKSASTNNATVGDSIIYTIDVNNSGNLPANLTLFDPIPAGTTFTPNSVTIGGFPSPGSSPVSGIAVGNVAPGATVRITFGVVVTSLPTPQQLSNQANSTYTFTTPDGRTLSGSAVSNTITFPVSSPDVTVTKSTPSTVAAIGDTVTYTVAIRNNGIEAVSNVLFSDQIPAGSSFVPGSVTINGVAAPTAVPSAGISLGTIAPSATTTVLFSVVVNSIPSSATLRNQASVNFTSGAFSGTSLSNIVEIPVSQPIIGVVKSASDDIATVGETLTYTLTVANTGNYPAQLTVTDNIPAGTSLVPNSVMVNNFPVPGGDPAAGINANTIQPGATTTVMFSVVIDTLPPSQQLVNQGTANYTFMLSDGRTLSGSSNSNTLTIPVSAPNISAVKSSTSTAVAVGDVITYTTAITNTGIDPVTNVVFTDPTPANTAFVTGSVTVDGTARATANPASGVSIGTIAPGATVNVAFNVTVTALPTPNTISNQSSVSFTSGTFSGVSLSNIVTIPVYQPILAAVKSANTANATVGDTVAYTVALNNTGNYGATVVLTDTIPAGTSFVPNSVLVNGSPVPGADPSTGIPVGNVTGSSTVTFSVVVNSLPADQLLSNQASATYSFILPDGRTLTGSLTSNTLVIPVSTPNVSVVKSTTTVAAAVGETITYSVVVTNSGLETVNNVVFSDPIPAGSIFNAGSVTVGGAARPTANPINGFSLGPIAPGDSVTVTFSVTVTSVPNPAQLSNRSQVSFTSGAFSGASFSNTVVTPIYQPAIGLVKSANTSNATVGDTVVYFFNVTNTGNWPATATLFDNIPAGASFVPNSVIVDGVAQPGANPTSGISVGTIAPGDTVNVSVSLQVTVDTLPNPQQLVNQGRVDFTFTLPDGVTRTGSQLSNQLVIPVSSPDVTVVKSTTAIDAVVGDVITYTITIRNNGLSPVNNVVMTDPVPAGTVFVTGSVTVDGTSRPTANPNVGIPIGTIPSATTVTITFQVRVVEI
ncbi:DUF7507 domain-containing protein [Paenibacillus sp. CAU 1782]